MNIKEFYDFIGENYNEVIDRLRVESRIVKYVTKFPADTCFKALCDAMNNKNYEEAFRAAHTMKGISLNLGFQNLFHKASEITEKLRNFNDVARIEADPSIDGLVKDISEIYNKIIEGINALDQ